MPNCIFQQKPMKCWVLLQQYKIIVPLGILHGLKRFHHYCLRREVCIITDHKPYIAILTKQGCDHIISVVIVYYAVHIPVLGSHFIQACPWLTYEIWLSGNNHTEDKNHEITNTIINAISTSVNIPVCTSVKYIHAAIWRCPPVGAEITHSTWMVIQKRLITA